MIVTIAGDYPRLYRIDLFDAEFPRRITNPHRRVRPMGPSSAYVVLADGGVYIWYEDRSFGADTHLTESEVFATEEALQRLGYQRGEISAVGRKFLARQPTKIGCPAEARGWRWGEGPNA